MNFFILSLTVCLTVISVSTAQKETLCTDDVHFLRDCLVNAYGTYEDLEEIPAWAQFNNECLNGPKQKKSSCSKISRALASNDHMRTANDVITRSQRQNLLKCMRETDNSNPKKEVKKCSAPENGNRVAFQKAKQDYEKHRSATYGLVRALNMVPEIIEECEYLDVASCVFEFSNFNVVENHINGKITGEYNQKACECFAQVPRKECKDAVVSQTKRECDCTGEVWEEHRDTAVRCGKKQNISEEKIEEYIAAETADACYDDDTLPVCKA